ncbi:predicted protein [Lichtheimia corymbifera JMRC:FSU:9682]|uniref:Uncharacterized protein n=1 Tax=Lichtheimia corymbifera JMRC:FSU:9682 TaxID=1263082 RepID=A0A068SAW8_9FUNG|nr:predicted protein [Lichtheimia corymbifera JMRC:FSU:9682]
MFLIWQHCGNFTSEKDERYSLNYAYFCGGDGGGGGGGSRVVVGDVHGIQFTHKFIFSAHALVAIQRNLTTHQPTLFSRNCPIADNRQQSHAVAATTLIVIGFKGFNVS